MKEYKVGDIIAIIEEELIQCDGFVDSEEIIIYGEIEKVIINISGNIRRYKGSLLDGDDFSVYPGEIDEELTIRSNRERKLKQLGIS